MKGGIDLVSVVVPQIVDVVVVPDAVSVAPLLSLFCGNTMNDENCDFMWYAGLQLHHRHEFFMFQKSYPIPHRHDVERIVTLSLFWELLFHMFLSF